MLVAGRAVQGLGGGGVVVLVHVCVADLFTIRHVFASAYDLLDSAMVDSHQQKERMGT